MRYAAYPPPFLIFLIALLIGAGATLSAQLSKLPANQFSTYAIQTLLAFPVSAFGAACLVRRLALRGTATVAWRLGMYAATYIAIAALSSVLLKIYMSVRTFDGDATALAAEILNPLTLFGGAWSYYTFMVSAATLTFLLFAALLGIAFLLPRQVESSLQSLIPETVRTRAWVLPAALAACYGGAVLLAAVPS